MRGGSSCLDRIESDRRAPRRFRGNQNYCVSPLGRISARINSIYEPRAIPARRHSMVGARCPQCHKRKFALYLLCAALKCRQCHRLRYVAKTWRRSRKLLDHYAGLTEFLEKLPGPKPRRYLRHLSREDEYCRKYLEELSDMGERIVRFRTGKEPVVVWLTPKNLHK